MANHFPQKNNSDCNAYQDSSLLEQPANLTVIEEFYAAARTFVGPLFILLPSYYRHPRMPHLHIDLSPIGIVRGGQYRVYLEGNRFLYDNDQRYFGENPRDQRLVAASPHGTRLFVQCFDGQSINWALIWICKRRDYPILDSSLHYRKSPEDSLQVRQPDQSRPREGLHFKTDKPNEVRSLQGRVTSVARSQVNFVVEPLFQPAISLSRGERSQVVGTGTAVNSGRLTATTQLSTVQGQGCTLVVGQLRLRQGQPSKLESHFRVRPREVGASGEHHIYGAFGRALIQHRNRYWFTLDPVLTHSSP